MDKPQHGVRSETGHTTLAHVTAHPRPGGASSASSGLTVDTARVSVAPDAIFISSLVRCHPWPWHPRATTNSRRRARKFANPDQGERNREVPPVAAL